MLKIYESRRDSMLGECKLVKVYGWMYEMLTSRIINLPQNEICLNNWLQSQDDLAIAYSHPTIQMIDNQFMNYFLVSLEKLGI